MQQELADSSNHSIYFIFKKSVCELCHKQYVTFGKFCILYVLLQRLVGKFQTLALTIFK